MLVTLVVIPPMDANGKAQLLGWCCLMATVIAVKGTVF